MPTLSVHGKGGVEVARTEVDEIDFVWASQYRWSLNFGYVCRSQRRGKECKPIRIGLHREILGLKHGYQGRVADHIDGDPLNNLRANLRVVSYAENAHNRKDRTDGTSKYRGVSWYTSKGCWRVAVMVHGTRTLVGYFDDEDEAGRAAAAFYAEHMPLVRQPASVTAERPGTGATDRLPYSLRPGLQSPTDDPSNRREI